MVNVRVVETLQNVGTELLQLLHREVEGLHEFLELYLVDVLTDNLVVASIADDVNAREVSNRRENGVRTVEQRNLTLVVRSLALGDENVKTCLLCRELLAELLDRHICWFLDNPEVEDFCLNNEVVLVANLLLDVGNLLAWEARNDAVNEGSANVVVLLEPLLESSVVSTEVSLPQLDVLLDAVLQVVTVEEDELARHDDKTLCRIAVEGLETTIEQLHELTWVRRSRSVGELTGVVESNTSLCGVRDYETNLWLLCQ